MNRFALVVLGLSALVAGVYSTACTCGKENLKSRIIYGQEAQRLRYPWMISLMTKQGENSYASCGASLINDRYILTAAHCIPSTTRPSDIIAMAGAHESNDRFRAGRDQKQLAIESIKVHENYQAGGRKMDDDIALLKLKEPVQFDDVFNPICIPNFSDYDNLFIYGWGRQNDGNRRRLKSGTALYEVDLQEVDNATCSREWGRTFKPEKEICAGHPRGAGTCQGDSGGPLSTRHRDGHVYQVAIVSFGVTGCNVEGETKSEILERVTAHLGWIHRNTADAQWCPGPSSPAFTRVRVGRQGAPGSFRSASPSQSRPYAAPSARVPSGSSSFSVLDDPSDWGTPAKIGGLSSSLSSSNDDWGTPAKIKIPSSFGLSGTGLGSAINLASLPAGAKVKQTVSYETDKNGNLIKVIKNVVTY